MTHFTISIVMLIWAAAIMSAQSATVAVQVPGTSDPWLAGMPNGSTASCEAGVCDSAPAQSPVLVTGLTITPGATLTFSASGLVSYGANHPFSGPNGGADSSGSPNPVQHDAGDENGISDILTQLSSLVGVFLGPDRPDLTPAPPIGGTLPRPALKQVFFVGSSQTVVVPQGATRLYLGVMDGYEWSNNPGSFNVTISQTSTTSRMPAVSSLNPVVSAGSSQSYVFQFSDPGGWQALSVVNVLFNHSLDGRQACYLAYSVPDNVLYLVPDSGTGLLPGLVLNGSGSTGNSQCTVSGAGSSASGSGNNLTLTLNVSFNSSFGGDKVVYMAARDASNNSGWQTMGVRAVAPVPATFPNPAGMSPASGNTANTTLTFAYQDANSASNLQTMWALINTALDGRSACYLAYYAPANQVFLVPDNGDGAKAAGMSLSGSNTLSNSQCTVSASGSGVVKSGAQAAVSLNIGFTPSFAGPKIVWMAAQTLGGAQTSTWQALGAWTVPGN